MRARTRAEAVALCWTTLKLAQVSLPARTCPHTVLLCGLAPKRSSTAQPDLRLHHVCGRRLSKAAVKAAFNGCRKAARGSSVATQGSSRRRPWCHRDVPPLAGEGLARGPDGRGSSSLVLWAASPVHQDILPSWGGFGAPVSSLGCVCSVIRKIAENVGHLGLDHATATQQQGVSRLGQIGLSVRSVVVLGLSVGTLRLEGISIKRI